MSVARKNSILIYGYGNPGRQDDGLGAAFVDRIREWIEERGITGIALDCNYQLNIEDALTISEKDIVIFVDASLEEIDSFCFTKVEPSDKTEFTMHAVSPAFVLDMSQKLYDSYPETYLLHIKGYAWELKEELTNAAQQNLNRALAFIKNKLQ